MPNVTARIPTKPTIPSSNIVDCSSIVDMDWVSVFWINLNFAIIYLNIDH
ncbi:MAG: hypothetical protein WB643_13010 [Candidatus Bathyarchaeia archaeon]